MLDVNSYKCLQPTMHILFYHSWPNWWTSQPCTFSTPHIWPCTKICPETQWDMQWNRKPEENECKLTKQSTDRHWNFEHVAYTWWFFLFMHAYSHEPQLQTCFPWHPWYKVPLITPTACIHKIHATKKKKEKKKYSPCCLFVCLNPHFHYIYNYYISAAWQKLAPHGVKGNIQNLWFGK